MLKPLTIVAVAVVAAIGLGVGFNLSEEPQTVTTYTTVADMTPTVEHETVSNYAPLSPSENWTGFYPYSTFSYTQMTDNSYNRYGIQPTSDPTITDIADIKTNAMRTFAATSSRVHVMDLGDGYLSNGTMRAVSGGYSVVTATNPISIKLLSYVASFPADSKVVCDFDAPCAIPLANLGSYSNSGVTVNLWACLNFGSGLQKLASKIVYTPASADQAAQWSGYDSLNNPVWVWDADSSNASLYVIWGGTWVSSYPLAGDSRGYTNYDVGSGPNPARAQITTTQYSSESIRYMDIRYGVSVNPIAVNSDRSTFWQNGYVNGIITMVIKTDSSGFTVGYSQRGRDTIFYCTPPNNDHLGQFSVTVPMSGSVEIPTMYPAVSVTIDAISNEIRISPILEFIDFVTYTQMDTVYTIPYQNLTSTFGDLVTLEPVEKLEIWGYNYVDAPNIGPYTIGIVYTEVATDPNNLLWLNPRILPTKWFPMNAASPYSVYFRSGVAFGDTLTINGREFPVSDGQIDIDGVFYPISGLSIDYNGGATGGDVLLRLPHGSRPIPYSLGDVQTTAITGTGIWYAQVDLRGIQTETKTHLVFDSDGWKDTTAKDVIILFMAICTVLSMWTMRNREMGAAGILTVIIALAIGWIILGMFI